MNEEIKNETTDNAEKNADNVKEMDLSQSEEIKEDKKASKADKKAQKKLEIELEELKKKNAELESEVAFEKDRALRIAAEYENFRRRSKSERESVYGDAYADAILKILPIIDNLERAEGFESAEDVASGVKMILNSARETLSKMGVEEIQSEGVEFDPNVHNAVMHTEDDTLGENVINAVLQKGYKRGDKIIRYAMVSVAN